MSELFPIESVTKKSPRLLWMEKYELLTFEYGEDEEGLPWTAYRQKDIDTDIENYSKGKTEHDAIAEWAIKNKVRLWNEEAK